MTIETVIDWLTTTNSLGVPNYCNVSTWVVAAILWGVVTRRWLAGRRKKREATPRIVSARTPEQQAEYDHLTEGIEAARSRHISALRGGFTYTAADALRAIKELTAMRDKLPQSYVAEPPKPAPDHKYQGDQISGIRKELLALEERVGRMEAAHYSLDWIVAQQMRDPHFEPVGPQPVEGDIVYNPDKKRYSVVESVGDEVYLDDGGSYHCWAFMSPAVVPDDRFGGEQRPRVLRRNPQ